MGGDNKERSVMLIRGLDKEIFFMAFVTTMAIAYYVNPLDNVELTDWNRTFCTAVLSGISIDKRIGNFYLMILLYIPLIYVMVLVAYNWVCSARTEYKATYMKFNAMVLFSVITSYFSRYANGSDIINRNLIIQGTLAFYIILTIVGIIDKRQQLDFSDHTSLFVGYVIAVLLSNILIRVEILTSIFIIGFLIVTCVAVTLYTIVGQKLSLTCKRLIYFLMWLPAFVRLLLEGIYFMTEHGRMIQRYYTHIIRFSIVYVITVAIVAYLLRNKERDLSSFGYVGAIVSMGTLSFFSCSYQYIWTYGSMSDVYETGNKAVAMDTVLYGKLPIIDYFSAHALEDVWTRIAYCLIHSDVKGILVNPYGGLSKILAYICLFYMIKMVLDKNIAILFVCLFPVSVPGIKLTSICCFSVTMLLYIAKKSGYKYYISYWFVVLVCAFVTYDEGICLGVGSIIAYILVCVFRKEWEKIREFILSGGIVGILALVVCIIYGIVRGLDVISRLREWMSVSVGSSSSWATANFGDASTLAFLVSYFLVPVCAVVILVLTVFKFIKWKKQPLLAAITMGFALTELLYVSRTIVYHNLAVCSGRTGVLLNFIHWSVAMYVLYDLALKEVAENKKILGWISALGIVIIMEGALVTGQLPSTNSVLYASAVSASESWDLQNNVTENWGKERIVFDEATNQFVGQFKYIFDTLMTENQTFIDFANVTSLYLLTDRERPFYVGQSPSLLTDIYSQECYLEELKEYDCPLAIVGITETSCLQQMVGIPHNVRYYKIAEYLYQNYRPLVNFGEFSIWCDKDLHGKFTTILSTMNLSELGYTLTDYGYDATESYTDETGNLQYAYKPYHSYGLGMVPYIWAHYDDYDAANNAEMVTLKQMSDMEFTFKGSQTVLTDKGNYLAFECVSQNADDVTAMMVFRDSSNEGYRFQYGFTVVPGAEKYLIRVSQDYFWDVGNIDVITYSSDEDISIVNVKILEGD